MPMPSREQRQSRQQPECCPSCPWCGTAKHVHTSGASLRSFYCGKCRREFDDDPDTDVGYGRPEKYAIRNENYAQAQARRARR
jgi:transposase-like protein